MPFTAPKTVLYVDDDPDDRLFICEAIHQSAPSLHCVEANNGVEAMAYLQNAKALNEIPCLILLDMNMPGMDGKQTLVAIKNDESLKEVPVVMFTTSSGQLDQLFCERFGVPMITKPNTERSFKECVVQILSDCTTTQSALKWHNTQ